MPQAFAFSFDHDDLRLMSRNWPEKICVALLVDASERAGALLYHEDETEGLPERIVEALNTPASGISTYPAMDGFDRTTLRFNERSTLLSSVWEELGEDLFEGAQSYLLDYRYAAQEGLDPDFYMYEHRQPIGSLQDAAAAHETPVTIDGPGAPGCRRITSLNIAQDDADDDTDDDGKAPQGYIRMSPGECRSSRVARGHAVMAAGGGVTITPGHHVKSILDFAPERVFVKDDLSGLAIDMAGVGDGIEHGLHLSVDSIPEPLLKPVRNAPAAVRMARVGRYMHISFPGESPDPVRIGEALRRPAMTPDAPPQFSANGYTPARGADKPTPRRSSSMAVAITVFVAFMLGTPQIEAHDADMAMRTAEPRLSATERLAQSISPVYGKTDTRGAFR